MHTYRFSYGYQVVRWGEDGWPSFSGSASIAVQGPRPEATACTGGRSMIAVILSAAAVAAVPNQAAASEPAPAPPAVYTNPDWLKKPKVEGLLAVWPVKALQQAIGCKVVLHCQVNTHGLLQQCQVASESRPGYGFGAAALLLAPSFEFRPAMGPDGPRVAMVSLPINFDTQGLVPARAGQPELLDEMSMVVDPTWAAAPTFADVGRAYPPRAGGLGGHVSLRCHITAAGALAGCVTLTEEPMGKGFAKAALSLTPLFRLQFEKKVAPNLYVNLPFQFTDPSASEFRQHRVALPRWVVLPDPNQMVRLYPAEAASRNIVTGRGVAECSLDRAGAMTACHPAAGTDDPLGFSAAAAVVATVMRANLWTQEGGPIDGAVIDVPVRFNLGAETPDTTPPPKP